MEFCFTHLPEWEKEIINKYPEIYLEKDEKNLSFLRGGFPDDYCNLRYGFEFGQGWAKIVDDFSAQTVAFLKEVRKLYPDAYIHSCVFKQKFGQATFQGSYNLPQSFLDPFFGLKALLEKQSLFTCELSGEIGCLRNVDGYLQVLSDEKYIRKLAVRKFNSQDELESWIIEPRFGLEADLSAKDLIDKHDIEQITAYLKGK